MQLREILDNLYARRSPHYLANDPLSFCHRFDHPDDQEIVGLVVSSLAYGRVQTIKKNLEQVISLMTPSPRRFVEKFEPRPWRQVLSGFRHRFNDGRDLCALFHAIQTMVLREGSIGEFFRRNYDASADDISESLAAFSSAVLEMDFSPVFGTNQIPHDSYFSFLFPSPASGSACKRLCMFLRWMVRPADGIDLGLWQDIPPAKLVIPVDAHIQRISRCLGLTCRKHADWKMAQEITSHLKEFDPQDPVKYDFSLCHIGISEGCTGKNREACSSCQIAEVCSGALNVA